jgi:hypothetical protein
MAYRFNKAKWMTGIIFEEYLRWLNRKMRGQRRKILLLIDNFSAHELGSAARWRQGGLITRTHTMASKEHDFSLAAS